MSLQVALDTFCSEFINKFPSEKAAIMQSAKIRVFIEFMVELINSLKQV